MKKVLLLIALLAIGTAVFLYKKSEENSRETVQSHLDYNYTFDKRDVFNDDASADLVELDQRIKELSEKAAMASAAVQAGAQPKIQKLRDDRAALGKKLEALKNATQAGWNDIKSDYQKSDQEMKSSLEQTWQWLAQKTPS
jgi:hypothetical protein